MVFDSHKNVTLMFTKDFGNCNCTWGWHGRLCAISRNIMNVKYHVRSTLIEDIQNQFFTGKSYQST